MKKMWGWIMVGFLVLILAVPGKVNAAASFKLYLENNDFTINVGQKKSIRLMADSGSINVSGANLTISYNDTIKVNKVVMNSVNFGTVGKSSASGGRIVLYGFSLKTPAELPKGKFEVATIEIEGVTEGAAEMDLVDNQVVGTTSESKPFEVIWTSPSITVLEEAVQPTEPPTEPTEPPAEPTDPPAEPTEKPVVPTATPVAGNGSNGVLKFRMSFAGVRSGAECAYGWPVSVVVMKGNNSKTYTQIQVDQDGEETNGLVTYRGEVLLKGFNEFNDISVFLKGPKHLQVKYAEDKQNKFFNQPGGSVRVDKDPDSTPEYDFSSYPLLAGDVVGPNGVQDGMVDGVDFSYVKSEVNQRSEGDEMPSDLNGNCKLESQDLTLLMLAMRDRQEQLY